MVNDRTSPSSSLPASWQIADDHGDQDKILPDAHGEAALLIVSLLYWITLELYRRPALLFIQIVSWRTKIDPIAL